MVGLYSGPVLANSKVLGQGMAIREEHVIRVVVDVAVVMEWAIIRVVVGRVIRVIRVIRVFRVNVCVVVVMEDLMSMLL